MAYSSGECDNSECSHWMNIVVKGTEGEMRREMRRGAQIELQTRQKEPG